MAETRTKHVGSLNGVTKEQAETETEQKWAVYRHALDIIGDTMLWQNVKCADNAETIKSDFGYFNHTESTDYQVWQLSSTETKKEVDYERDCYYTVNTEIYTPATVSASRAECLKVVRRGKSKHIAELENEFLNESRNYYEVKAGFSSELPRKSISIAYNILLLLSGILLSLFVLFSPAILPEYAQSLSADVLLFKLINAQGLPINAPVWICYVTFALSVVCIVALIYVNSLFSKFIYRSSSGIMLMCLITVIVAFGLGYLMNDWYKDLMTSGNPLFWIPLGLFCASRALTPVLSVFAIVLALRNLITDYPHKKICGAITEKSNRLNDYIDSGRYQKSCDLLAEIISYNVNTSVVDEITKILVKINELNSKKDKLRETEKTEFIDKSADIAELDIRLNKAQARIKELCENNPTDRPSEKIQPRFNAKSRSGG